MFSMSSGNDDATQPYDISKTPCLLTSVQDVIAQGIVQPKH